MLDFFLYVLVIFIPSLFWIYFWLREDEKESPEPLSLVLKVFFVSWFSAILAIVIQSLITKFFSNKNLVPILFVLTEEVLKFLPVYIIALKTKYNNERTDPILYLIIGAIGFATLENILFFIQDFINHGANFSIMTSLYRTIGATQIHIASSFFLGLALSLTYYKKKHIRILALHIGLFLAIGTHLFFNYLISQNNSLATNLAFYTGWFLIFIILAIFELLRNKIKKD